MGGGLQPTRDQRSPRIPNQRLAIAPLPLHVSLAEFRRIFDQPGGTALRESASGRRHRYDEVQALLLPGFRAGCGCLAEHGGFDVDLPTLFELLAESGPSRF